MSAQKQLPGFDILYIRNVPPGAVLNKENADLYPLIECGTWLYQNRHWMIQIHQEETPNIQATYKLLPHTQEAEGRFYNRYHFVTGTYDEILKIIKSFYPYD